MRDDEIAGRGIPTALDRAVIAHQLGRDARGLVRIARRCRNGHPQVIVTEPLIWDEKSSQARPVVFPTVYWLTCPHLVKAVSRLESESFIAEMRDWVESDGEVRRALESATERYKEDRLAMVPNEVLEQVRRTHPGIGRSIAEGGIGGMSDPGGVKCLHLHLADYLATGDNPIGQRVVRLIEAGGSVSCTTGLCRLCRVAVLNVGSNSVKLLVADGSLDRSMTGVVSSADQTPGDSWAVSEPCRSGAPLRIIDKVVTVTGLARRIGSSGLLDQDAVDRTIEVVLDHLRQARAAGAKILTAFGTEALRAANDRSDFIDRLARRSSIELGVISGEEEASLAFTAAVSSLYIAGGRSNRSDSGSSQPVEPPSASRHRGGPQNEDSTVADRVVVIDVGGASTEIVVGTGVPEQGISRRVGHRPDKVPNAAEDRGCPQRGAASSPGLAERGGPCTSGRATCDTACSSGPAARNTACSPGFGLLGGAGSVAGTPKLEVAVSLRMGAMIALETLRPLMSSAGSLRREDVESSIRYCRERLRESPQFSQVIGGFSSLEARSRVVCVGGTATSAAAVELGLDRYDRDRIHGFVLTRAMVRELLERLATSTRERRSCWPGILDPLRAEPTLGGLVLLSALLDELACPEVTVSEYGVVEGAALELIYRTCGIGLPVIAL